MSDYEKVSRALSRDGYHKGTTEGDIARVLAASGMVGPNLKRVADLTGLPYETVRVWGQKARQAGIWVGSKVHASDGWDDGIAFALDVAVVEGFLDRVDA